MSGGSIHTKSTSKAIIISTSCTPVIGLWFLMEVCVVFTSASRKDSLSLNSLWQKLSFGHQSWHTLSLQAVTAPNLRVLDLYTGRTEPFHNQSKQANLAFPIIVSDKLVELTWRGSRSVSSSQQGTSPTMLPSIQRDLPTDAILCGFDGLTKLVLQGYLPVIFVDNIHHILDFAWLSCSVLLAVVSCSLSCKQSVQCCMRCTHGWACSRSISACFWNHPLSIPSWIKVP